MLTSQVQLQNASLNKFSLCQHVSLSEDVADVAPNTQIYTAHSKTEPQCPNAGFMQQFASIVDPDRPEQHIGEVLKRLSGGRTPSRILCTGHSLGGALATLGELMLLCLTAASNVNLLCRAGLLMRDQDVPDENCTPLKI